MRVSPRAKRGVARGDARAPRFADAHPVIPAKAGIQMMANNLAIRSQAPKATSGSLLPSREKARMRVSPRASAALRAGRPRSHDAQTYPL